MADLPAKRSGKLLRFMFGVDRGIENDLRLRAERFSQTPIIGAIKRDLRRYYAMLADTLPGLQLSALEAMALVAATDRATGWKATPATYRYLWAHVADRPNMPPSLTWKLRQCNPAQLLALADACERYHLATPEDEALTVAGVKGHSQLDRLIAHGLYRPSTSDWRTPADPDAFTAEPETL